MELEWPRICGLSAAFGSLATDAALVAGRLERATGITESFALHIAQDKGFLFCALFRRLEKLRFIWLCHSNKDTFGNVVCWF